MSRLWFATCLVALGSFAATSYAEPAEPSSAASSDPEDTLSLTTDSLVIVGVANAGIEANVVPHVGVGAMGGVSVVAFDSMIKVWVVGASANYYVMRKFAGLHVGIEAQRIAATSMPPSGTTTTGTGLGYGVYLGYKWMRPSGFTAVIAMGIGKTSVTVSDPSSSFSDSQIRPVGNLAVGYSF